VSATQVHATAHVDARAELGDGVQIGPHCIVGPEVVLGPGVRLDSHVVVEGPTRIGEGCRFHPFSSIGSDPQDLKYDGERTRLEIGSSNSIREFVTVNRGTSGGGGITRIGDCNLLMAYSHVAHDCQVGSSIIMANAATLAGHVTVQDGATVGAFSGVHQYCRVGREAFIGGYSVVTQDAVPFVKTVGNRARTFGINAMGLQRKGYAAPVIEALQTAYRTLFRAKLSREEALGRLEAEFAEVAEVQEMVAFLRTSQRGVVR
jgi:UDP-N-acetylglucosamine acyltransferase